MSFKHWGELPQFCRVLLVGGRHTLKSPVSNNIHPDYCSWTHGYAYSDSAIFFSTLRMVSSIVPAGRQNLVLGNGPCDVINGDVIN